ncbi:MAG: hypothetical protein HY291_04695 [Planctomycetes bacterium]|nr:hypothetical protein [Planctomycetota bacterium]
MDEILERLTAYVASKDARLACASAVVLAELAPQQAAVVRDLRVALEKSDPVRRPFIIEALGRIGTPEAAQALVPVIEAGGPSAEDALRAVAHAGAGALKPLAGLLKKAHNDLRVKLAEAISRTGESQGFAALFGELRAADANAARSLREGMHRALQSLDEKGRGALLHQTVKALETKAYCENEPAFHAAAELAGELGDPEALPALLSFAGLKADPRLRRAALLAVARIKLDPERRGRMAGKLLPLLEESDYGQAVEPALIALRDAEIGAEFRAALQRLVNSQLPQVRDFAMKKLAAGGSARNLQDLVACLEDADPSVRESAASALSKAPGAAPLVAERLLKMASGAASRLAARVLQDTAPEIPGRTLAALAKTYVELATGAGAKAGESQDADTRREADERRGAVLAVLRASGSEVLAETAAATAAKLRNDGDNARALGLMKSIAGIAGWRSPQKLELALAGLSLVPLDIARPARNNNANLRLIEEVLADPKAEPKPLAKRLLKDDSIERRVLGFIGHHFSERMHGDRDFGRVLLEGLAANPRSDEGKQAREKLVLEGMARSTKASKAGILEERAKVMMAAADMAAKAAADEARRARKAKGARSKSKVKARGKR